MLPFASHKAMIKLLLIKPLVALPGCLLVALTLILFVALTRQRSKVARDGSIQNPGDSVQSDVDPTSMIAPLHGLALEDVRPIDYLPYKTQGHVTMGIQKRQRQDWIRMDRGYKQRICDREALIRNHATDIVGTGKLVDPAIAELYEEVMVDYLPKRFPTLFERQGSFTLNRVTGKTFPTSSVDLRPDHMLRIMGTNVEEDFYFMCPDKCDGEYRLRGYIACFPGGFLSPSRVGESVREIHRPVPGYDSKLGHSVDRYFARMQPRHFIGRMNWSLQVDGADLFRVDGNNFYPGMDTNELSGKQEPDIEQCYLRVEHQTLCKLPRCGAVVFCVRSYMTPLRELRDRGEGAALADAIESMPQQLGEYKMRHLWGEKIQPWLRA